MDDDPNELICVTLSRAEWRELDRQASTYMGVACEDDPALETIRAALKARSATDREAQSK